MADTLTYPQLYHAAPDFHIRVADDLGNMRTSWPRTERLGLAHCYVFQCADYLRVWCDTIGKARGTRAFFIGIFDAAGQPILFLPFGIEKQHGLRILSFLDGGVCDYNSPIVFEPSRSWTPATLQKLWEQLLSILPRFDIAIFKKMPADVSGVPNPLIDLRSEPFTKSGHFVQLTGSWEQYIAKQLPFRRKSGQQRRKLAKTGPVRFTVAQTQADQRRIVEAMMRQKSRRCIETGQFDELELPGYKEYYRAMTERFPWPGPLLVTAVEVRNEVVATSWSMVFNERLLWLVTTFESGQWRRFSVGRILLEDLIKWSFHSGIMIFNSGVGDEKYKLGYFDKQTVLHQAHIPVTLLGRAYQGSRNTKVWKLFRHLVKERSR